MLADLELNAALFGAAAASPLLTNYQRLTHDLMGFGSFVLEQGDLVPVSMLEDLRSEFGRFESQRADDFFSPLRCKHNAKTRILSEWLCSGDPVLDGRHIHTRGKDVLRKVAQGAFDLVLEILRTVNLNPEIAIYEIREATRQAFCLYIAFGVLDEYKHWKVSTASLFKLLFDYELSGRRCPSTSLTDDRHVNIAARYCVKASISRRLGKGWCLFVDKYRLTARRLDTAAGGFAEGFKPLYDGADKYTPTGGVLQLHKSVTGRASDGANADR